MAQPLVDIWGVILTGWDSITPANIITWLVMVGGWVAFWVKLKDRVDGHGAQFAEVNKRLDSQDKVLEEIKTQGSPAGRASSILINSRLESQNHRLLKVEDAVVRFAAIEAHVEWMKDYLKDGKRTV